MTDVTVPERVTATPAARSALAALRCAPRGKAGDVRPVRWLPRR